MRNLFFSVLVGVALLVGGHSTTAEACGAHGCGSSSSFNFSFQGNFAPMWTPAYRPYGYGFGACGVQFCGARFPVLRALAIGVGRTAVGAARIVRGAAIGAARIGLGAIRLATAPARALFGRPIRRWGW